MYPGNYNIEWLGYKGGEPVEEAPKLGSVARAWQWRERGVNPPNQPPNKTVLENIAEDILVQKPLQITSCDLPGFPRSTFLMVFSPDGTKLASTHGNHNIYVSELASGKHVRILRGHPRTPWCIAFHPSHPQLIGSGCLGGQVRVWDIASGGSEVWNVYNETVIASIAFHPREQLLVIATYNELYFWDWSQPAPFTKVSTKNTNEKVRYVAFDSLGFKLITGISLWACSSNSNSTPLVSGTGPPNNSSSLGNNGSPANNGGPGNDDPGNGGNDNGGPGSGGNGDSGHLGDDGPAHPGHASGTTGAVQDMIVNSYETLVQRYDSLVRNYQRLFMVRHRLINTPPLANTIDRGTDPMESYPLESGRLRRRPSRRTLRPTATTDHNITTPPTPGTSQQAEPPSDSRAASPPLPMANSVINWEGITFSPVSVRSADSPITGVQGVPVIRSIASAFRPLNDDRTVRLLPNPFSSTNGSPQQSNTSRTSGIYRGPESALSALRQFSIRRRNLDAAENAARELAARNAQNTSNGVTANNSETMANNSGNAANNLGTAANNSTTLVNNSGTAVTSTGTVATSTGTTANSNRAVTNNTSTNNSGTASTNAGTVTPNTRTATHNSGTAVNNIGTALNITRTVTVNARTAANSSRTITNNARTATNNFGTAANNSGTAANNIRIAINSLDLNSTRTVTNNTGTVLNNAETGIRNTVTLPASTASPSSYIPPPLPTEPPPARPPPPPEPTPGSSSQRTMGTDPTDPDGEAHTINESLDLIRDILRDSGTRLLNLITNMSMSILSNSECNENAHVPVHVCTGNLRRDFMASSSDSETEHTEVNITRTPNTTFREGLADTNGHQTRLSHPSVETNRLQSSNVPQISNRMTFEPDPNVTPSVERMSLSDRMTFDLDVALNAGPAREGGINVTMSNDRFSVRSQSDRAPTPLSSAPAPSPSPSPLPSTSTSSATAEPQPGPSSAPDATDFDPDVPSTSRDNFWSRGPEIPAAEAIRRVKMGVSALQKHTLQLANMWLRGDRTTMRELRSMWEDLRRRIMALHREAGGRADTPSFYTRSLLERCMILTELTEMTDLSTRPYSRFSRRAARSGDANQAARSTATNQAARSTATNQATSSTATNQAASSTATNEAASSNATNQAISSGESSQPTRPYIRSEDGNQAARTLERSAIHCNNSSNLNGEPSTSADAHNNRATRTRAQRIQRNKRLVRLQQAYRWRAEDEVRRRDRNSPVFRMSHLRSRHRSNLIRTVEQNATRHIIRTRAMKVLSVMFNMMMLCLEERGLSQLIINMLKTLKKALALTCFMMMSNRNMPRPTAAAAPAAQTAQSVDSADVVRIQNVEHTGPVNVDDAYDPHSLRVIRYDSEPASTSQPSTEARQTASTSSTQTTPVDDLPSPLTNSASQSWSHRLAVQIAAANRNYSSTAKTRRDLYHETRRQKALHRTNPTAYPYIRRRFPPVSSHRIPAMRSLPPGRFHHRVSPRSPPPGPDAGPSTAPDQPSDPTNSPYDRENFIRLAHIRLRTAARNRFRRLQTIRLYTPSSVREMFALHDSQQENRAEPNRTEEEELEVAFGANAPLVRTRAQIHALMAGEGVLPLMQVNDLPAASEAQPGQAQPSQAQRLPRIHEYLQPIILAQNAMVVDDSDGGGGGAGPGGGAAGQRRFGGMAGLLDAGIISEALPAPSHRVQAWDFTTGAAPDIADNTKNVVVQRCRIHNDASIDISKDGRLLVALLPVPRLRNTNNWLGVYSLEWPRLGQCLHTAVLEQSAVSVALSPTARYLAVGLGSRRFTSSHSRTNIIALLYKLDPLESSSRTGLSPMKELEQYWEHGFTSLNCLRWAPQPGQGLVYANNTGQLIIMS